MSNMTTQKPDCDYSLFGSPHWVSHLQGQMQSNALSDSLGGKKKVLKLCSPIHKRQNNLIGN